jgi:hypothetical protein
MAVIASTPSGPGAATIARGFALPSSFSIALGPAAVSISTISTSEPRRTFDPPRYFAAAATPSRTSAERWASSPDRGAR